MGNFESKLKFKFKFYYLDEESRGPEFVLLCDFMKKYDEAKEEERHQLKEKIYFHFFEAAKSRKVDAFYFSIFFWNFSINPELLIGKEKEFVEIFLKVVENGAPGYFYFSSIFEIIYYICRLEEKNSKSYISQPELLDEFRLEKKRIFSELVLLQVEKNDSHIKRICKRSTYLLKILKEYSQCFDQDILKKLLNRLEEVKFDKPLASSNRVLQGIKILKQLSL